MEKQIELKTIKNKEEFTEKYFPLIKLENWDFVLYSYELYGSLGWENFYYGEIENKVAFIFCLVPYAESKLLYFGYYISAPEFRNKGIVFPFFNKVYQQKIQGYNLVLTGSMQMTESYIKKMDLSFFGYMVTKSLIVKDTFDDEFHNIVSDTKEVDQLINYDFENCGYDRKALIKKCTELIYFKVISYIENNKIKGFTILSEYNKGYSFLPLIADSNEIAMKIIKYAANLLPKGSRISVYFPDIQENMNKKDLFKQLGFQDGEEYSILGHVNPILKPERIYGILSSNIGL